MVRKAMFVALLLLLCAPAAWLQITGEDVTLGLNDGGRSRNGWETYHATVCIANATANGWKVSTDPWDIGAGARSLVFTVSDNGYSTCTGSISSASVRVMGSLVYDATRTSATQPVMIPLKIRSISYGVSSLPTAATTRIDTSAFTVESATSVYTTYTDVETAYTPASFEPDLGLVVAFGAYVIEHPLKHLSFEVSNASVRAASIEIDVMAAF